MENPIVQMAVVATFFTVVTGLIQYYIWRRLVADAAIKGPLRTILTISMILLGLSVVAAMIIAHIVPPDQSRLITFGPLVWQGSLMLLFFVLLVTDTGKLIHFLYRKLSRTSPEPIDPQRRQFIGRVIAGSAALVVTGMSGTAVAQAARRTTVISRDILLKSFPEALNGLKLVQISDIHIGLTITGEFLQDVVRQVNALSADVVVITGDLVDGPVPLLAPHVAFLKDIQAPRGVFFVTGNHEYYSDVKSWIPHIESLGIRVLRNERVEIGEGDNFFYLAGVNDYTAAQILPEDRPDLDRALEGRLQDKEVVLLAHQPREIENAARHNVGLMLSGHTHGGQIWPFSYFVGLQQPYNKGWYRHESGTQIYVNQGTGLWGPPMRLGTESEITCLSLRRG